MKQLLSTVEHDRASTSTIEHEKDPAFDDRDPNAPVVCRRVVIDGYRITMEGTEDELDMRMEEITIRTHPRGRPPPHRSFCPDEPAQYTYTTGEPDVNTDDKPWGR